ncbi:hypothetical protein AGMMS4952_09400 [Spirochaetia bacterium]|nr:hypothetical protein AGMMS4952_09400 [Spirochaetia bacterium]
MVMCLIADKDTTFLFEQPELHLHPRVQSRLGEFFLSMALLNKQCIIETHSEYLIDKIRYRIVEEQGDKTTIHDSVKLYFAEKDKKDGYTKFNEIVREGVNAVLAVQIKRLYPCPQLGTLPL